MLTSAQAEPWLLSNEKISSDELAVLVLGKPPAAALTSTEVVVSLKNPDNQMVLLHCHLFQLGTTDVTYKPGDPLQVAGDKCALVAVTLHRDDFPAELG